MTSITLFNTLSPQSTAGGSAATTVNSVPVGAAIVVAVHHSSGQSVTGVTCTGEAALTLCGTAQTDNNGSIGETFEFWRLIGNVTSSGNKTITVTLNGGS